MTRESWKQPIVLLLIPSLLVLAFICVTLVAVLSLNGVTLAWALMVLFPTLAIYQFSAMRLWGAGAAMRMMSLRRRMAASGAAVVGFSLIVLGFGVWPHVGDKALHVFAAGSVATAMASLLEPLRRGRSFASLMMGLALMLVVFAKGW